MSWEKQVADVYFDEKDGVYRALVEYFNGEKRSPVVVPVEFSGEAEASFKDIRETAFSQANEVLEELLRLKS